MNIVFMGTAGFAVPALQRLIDSRYTVTGVITQPDKPVGRGLKVSSSPVKALGTEHGLRVMQPDRLRDELTRDEILGLKPDLGVVAAYGKILPVWMFEDIPHGVINIHGSLLPAYRGAAPIQRAIMNGDSVTGVTIAQVEEGLDTGDILKQVEMPVGEDETAGELSKRMAERGADLLMEVIAEIEAGTKSACPQPPDTVYADKIEKSEARIDWAMPAKKIHDLIRALNPAPGAFTDLNNKSLKVWRSHIHSLTNDNKPAGEVIDITSKGFIVRCGAGSLLITEVQPESKKRMSGAEFARGYRLRAGDLLQ